MISILLPTYNEAENIKHIIPMLCEMAALQKFQYEIIVIDDDSPDKTGTIAEKFAIEYPVIVKIRKNEKGLSSAVIKGFELAQGDICVLMDADLSHPVQTIPEMIRPILNNECDMTVGSRYIEGGGWVKSILLRELISKVACFLARGITYLSDPTSGFMAVKKSIIKDLQLDPLGWKIVLEIAVKANPKIREIPIKFAERSAGESKLDWRVEIDYIRHLWRLYRYKFL